MPALEYPTAAELTSWHVKERGVRENGAPVERFEVDSSTAERTFFVEWAHRYDFVKYALGYAEVWNDSGELKLSRLVPLKHPELDGLYATKVTRIRGHKWTGTKNPPALPPDADAESEPEYQFSESQANVYEHAEITVLYEHVPYVVAADGVIESELDRYVSIDSYEVSGEYLTLQGSSFAYLRFTGTDPPHNQTIPSNPGKILPGATVNVTWHRLPDDAWGPGSSVFDRVFSGTEGDNGTLGKINQDEIFGFPIGSLLLSGVRPMRRKSPLGTGFEWDITFEFTYKPSGHNWLFYHDRADPTRSGFYFVGQQGGTAQTADALFDGVSIYNAASFADLFSVAAV